MLSKKILEIWAGGGNDIKLKLTFILPEEWVSTGYPNSSSSNPVHQSSTKDRAF
jgi:hypothetical protein